MADSANDLVISYVVHANGKTPGSDVLQAALDKGYRVADVLMTPVTPGGAGTGYGHTTVTVVLTNQYNAFLYHQGKGDQ